MPPKLAGISDSQCSMGFKFIFESYIFFYAIGIRLENWLKIGSCPQNRRRFICSEIDGLKTDPRPKKTSDKAWQLG